MQTLKVNKGELLDVIHLPTSKSYANRALILAAIDFREIQLSKLPLATDVTILLDSLKKIGLNCIQDDSSVLIKNSFPECEREDVELNVGEGGTTARFLAALVLLGNKRYKLKLGERLKERPWKDFLDLVKLYGAKAQLDHDILTLQGPLKLPKMIEVDCSKTTQFATALELIGSRTNCKIVPIHLASSQSYWAMTQKITEDLKKNTNYDVPIDWSSASYPMAYAALNQKISFPELTYDELQADAKFYGILEKSKSLLSLESSGLMIVPGVSKQNHQIDVSDALDLVPTLAFYLAHIEGQHVLNGIGNLIHKESNRLLEVIKLLQKFNRKSHTDGINLWIDGHGEILNEEIDLIMPDDHRMVMVGTLFLLHHGGGSISPVESVNKSYPHFFQILK